MIKLLHENIDELEAELDRYKRAMYRVCADFVSLTYPKNGDDVDLFMQKYLNEKEPF